MLLEKKHDTEAQLLYLIDFLKSANIDKHKIVLLGLDIGAKSIGVATWRYDTKVSIPNSTVKRVNMANDLAIIHGAMVAQCAIALVVGIHHSIEKHDDKFAMAWNAKWPDVPVLYADERFSTSLAHTLMRGVGISRRRRHEVDNEVAASIFLSDFSERLSNLISGK